MCGPLPQDHEVYPPCSRHRVYSIKSRIQENNNNPPFGVIFLLDSVVFFVWLAKGNFVWSLYFHSFKQQEYIPSESHFCWHPTLPFGVCSWGFDNTSSHPSGWSFVVAILVFLVCHIHHNKDTIVSIHFLF